MIRRARYEERLFEELPLKPSKFSNCFPNPSTSASQTSTIHLLSFLIAGKQKHATTAVIDSDAAVRANLVGSEHSQKVTNCDSVPYQRSTWARRCDTSAGDSTRKAFITGQHSNGCKICHGLTGSLLLLTSCNNGIPQL